MTMEECMIICRLEVAEHRAVLDKIQLSENLATGDKNAVSIARATITIYVPPPPPPPPYPTPAPLSSNDSFSNQTASSPCQSPSLHAQSTAVAAVQPAVEVNSYVQSCTRHTLPGTAVTVTAGSTGSAGGTCSAAAVPRECGNSDGASVEHSVQLTHTAADNNNNNDDDKTKDNRELLRKIAENYRILNRRDAPKRPTNNYSIVSRRIIKRTVHKHKTQDDALRTNTEGNKMTTPNVNDDNSIPSTGLAVRIDRAQLGDGLNTLLDNGTLQPSTSTAVNNAQEQEDTARHSSDSSVSSTDRSTASSSSLEEYLMKEYEKCRARGECFDTSIMTRHQRELLQLQADLALMTDEEELPPAGHRQSWYRIKKRMSSKMKKKQALLATFGKGTVNGESVKVSPTHRATPSSSSSSDSESPSAHTPRKKTSKHSERTPPDTACRSSSDTGNHSRMNETATVESLENSVPAATATVVAVKRKIRPIDRETLARYMVHFKQKQRNNSDKCETATNIRHEDTVIGAGIAGSAGSVLHGEPLVTGDVEGGGRTVVSQCSTQTLNNSNSNSVSVSVSDGETRSVAATVQCNSGSASRVTTRKVTRIPRNGRRFFRHNTIPYIKPRKRVQLRKTFSASLINLVDKSIEISKQTGTSHMNNREEPSDTSKLRKMRKAKTPKRKRINASQDGSTGQQAIATEDVRSAPGAGCSTSTSSYIVTHKGYSTCNNFNVNNSTEIGGPERDPDNENNYLVTYSDNTTFNIEYESGEITHVTNEKYASSNEDSMNNDRTVEKQNVTSNGSAQQSSDDEPHNACAQPACDTSDTAQPGTCGIKITDVRTIAISSDDEASNAGISVIPEYLLKSRQPSDRYGNEPRHSCALPSSANNNNSTARCEQPSDDGVRLGDINDRLHKAHRTPNKQKENTETDDVMLQLYQLQMQHNHEQLSVIRGSPPPYTGTDEMLQLSPNGRHMLPLHQYQTRECGNVPETSPQPPSYRSTVKNMINQNIPLLSMAAKQSVNPALDLRRSTNIPIQPTPAPLSAYPAHMTNPMIHSPTNPPHPLIPAHVNPMPVTLALPTNRDSVGYRYIRTSIPPSSQAAPRPGANRDDDMYKIRPGLVVPPSEQTHRQVLSPIKQVTQHNLQSMVHSAPQRPVPRCTVQSPAEREERLVSNHTVESMIRPSTPASTRQYVVQSPRQIAGTLLTVQVDVHQPPKKRAQKNHTPPAAPTSTERVRVECVAYPSIEDIVNKAVQSPAILQDRVHSPAVSEDRVPSPTSEQNVVQSEAEDKVQSPAQSILVLRAEPAVEKTLEVKVHSSAARQEPDVHSSTRADDATGGTVSATEESDDENTENQQVTTAASDSGTITTEEVNNTEARLSSTVCNTSANVEQSEENNEVIPAPVPQVDTPRARPRRRSWMCRRYWQTPTTVRFRRTIRARRLVIRQNYRRRIRDRSTTTKKDAMKCELKNEQAIETSSVRNNELVPSTSAQDNADPGEHRTPDRMNVPVNFYSQTDEPPVYASTVISQGIEALHLAQMYIETFQNNHDTMRDLQHALRELIANVNTNSTGHGEHTNSRISHTEHLLKQFLRNQSNIRTEFVIQHDLVASHNGTQQSNNPRAIFTVQRLQEALEKLSVLLTQLRDSVAAEHAQQRKSEEQTSINSSNEPDEPVVNVQVPWSRVGNIVVDNAQPSTSRGVSATSNQSSGGEQVTTPQDDVKYKYALGRLEARKLDNNKCTPQPSPAVNTREENEIVTELLDNGVTIQCSIPVHSATDQNIKPDEENSNVPSVSQILPTSDDTSVNSTPEVSSELHAPPPPSTDIPRHHNPTSGSASGIVGPQCQICCSFAKHEQAKRDAQKTSTATNNEQSTLSSANQEQQKQQSASQTTELTLINANQEQQKPVPQKIAQQKLMSQPIEQQQPISQAIDPTLISANEHKPISQTGEPTLIITTQYKLISQTITNRPQPILHTIQPTLTTTNQHQPIAQTTEPRLINANQPQQQQQLSMAQPLESSAMVGPNRQGKVPKPSKAVNRSQIQITTTPELLQLATESADNTSQLSVQSAITHVEDVVLSAGPSPSTHVVAPTATPERHRSDSESLSSAACKMEEYQDARNQSSTSHSIKRHVADTPSTDDGSKRARLERSTSATITPAPANRQSVPPADFMAAVNQRLENTETLIRTLINKKERKRSTARDEEQLSQSSVSTLFTECTPSCSTPYIHRPPETPHYNPLSSHRHPRQRHHTPRPPSYNVPAYQRSIYANQPAMPPQTYHAEQYVRPRGTVTPFQQRVPTRYVPYPVVSHPGLPLPACVPLHSPVQPSEPLPQYIPLPRRTTVDLTMTPPPPPPPSQVLNYHEYRSRRSSHRNNLSATSSTVRPHHELFSEFMDYVPRHNLNMNISNNNGTDSNSTMYPVVQVPPFPAEVLQGKQYNTVLCKYYQKPSEHSLMKYTINSKSKHTKTNSYKQRTDNNNSNHIITSIGGKNTVIDHVHAKRNPHSFHHVHRHNLPSQVHENNSKCDTQSDRNKTHVPPGTTHNTKHTHNTTPSVVLVVKQNNRAPVSEHGGAKHAVEMAAARLQVEQLNSFIENNRGMLLRDTEPCIRPETLRKYAVTDEREIHRLFDIVTLTDSDQYYRSLWCMWSVAENKHLYEFYRTVTQLQIRAGQSPFAIRIFIALLRCKYFGSVRKLTEDQCKRS